MTEQERPRTEAVLIRVSSSPELLGIVRAREIQRDIQRLIDRNWGAGVTVAIEAEALEAARTEGRQQAVREAVDLIMSEPYWPRLGAIRRKRIAERVAGLNASESPPTLTRCPHCDGGGCAVCFGTGQTEDASESGQPPREHVTDDGPGH